MRFDFSFGASNPEGNTGKCTDDTARDFDFLVYHPEAFASAWRDGIEFKKEDGHDYLSILLESNQEFRADVEFKTENSAGRPEKVREVNVVVGINDISFAVPELSSELKEIVFVIWRYKNEKLMATHLEFHNFRLM